MKSLFPSIAILLATVCASFADWPVVIQNNSASATSFHVRLNTANFGTNSPSVPPGGSHTWLFTDVTFTNSGVNNKRIYVRQTGTGTFADPTNGYLQTYTGTRGGTFTWGGATPPSTNCNYQFPLLNNNASIQTFYAAKNLSIDMTKTLVLGPGQAGILEFDAPCAESNQWSVLWAPYGEPDNVDVEAQITNLDDTPGTNLIPVIVEKPAPTSYDSATAWGGGTNAPILFTGTNDTQVGFSALYDAITKHAAQTDANLKALQGLTPTNGTGWPTDFPDSGTHERLDLLINLQTNGGIGDFTNAWSLIPDEKDAFETAMTIEGGSDFNIPSYSDADWKVSLIADAPEFDFSFTQRGLDGVWSTGKALILWGLIISYVIKVMKDIFDICFLVGAGSQLKAPNVDIKFLGTGGNWGLALAPVVVGLFLLIWAAALLWMTGALASVFTGISWTSIMFGGPFGTVAGAIASAVGASALLVPWEQVFAVASAYIVFLGTKNICAGATVTGIKALIS